MGKPQTLTIQKVWILLRYEPDTQIISQILACWLQPSLKKTLGKRDQARFRSHGLWNLTRKYLISNPNPVMVFRLSTIEHQANAGESL